MFATSMLADRPSYVFVNLLVKMIKRACTKKRVQVSERQWRTEGGQLSPGAAPRGAPKRGAKNRGVPKRGAIFFSSINHLICQWGGGRRLCACPRALTTLSTPLVSGGACTDT